MKLLFDQNLSPHLVERLKDLFPDSQHVSTVGLASAPDLEVWTFARENGFVIASKDSDLSEIGMLRGFPPYVVWIRRGNCSTSYIESLIRRNSESIQSLETTETSGVLILY